MAAMRRLSVSLDEQEYDELAAMSDKHRVSMAWLARHAIAEFIDRYRHEELQLPLRLPHGRRAKQDISRQTDPESDPKNDNPERS